MKIVLTASLSGVEITDTHFMIPLRSAEFLYLKKMAEKAATDEIITTISVADKNRTTGERSQNHHINGHIQTIAQETGSSFGAVKEHVKKLAIDRGYPFMELRDGTILPCSESDITTVQAGFLIEAIHQFAAEFGIRLKGGDE